MACERLYISGLKANALYEIIFAGPNITTPTSIAGLGIAVKTQDARCNDKGILLLALDGGHTTRLRFRQV